jgi:hypothetical protein
MARHYLGELHRVIQLSKSLHLQQHGQCQPELQSALCMQLPAVAVDQVEVFKLITLETALAQVAQAAADLALILIS